jgi:magnesium transporter
LKLPFSFFLKKKSHLAPGSLVHVGERKVEKTRLRIIDYDEEHLIEKQIDSIEECFSFKDTKTVSWINIDGLHETEIFEKLGSHFNIHPLILADMLNTTQRPKFEESDGHLLAVCKMFSYDDENNEVLAEQVSLLIGSDYLITLQERYGDVFEPVRERIRKSKGRIRKMGPDYLAYALIDVIIDSYYVVLEKIGERLEVLEKSILERPSPDDLNELHVLKRNMISLRRSIWPLRDVVKEFYDSESEIIHKDTEPFMRDLYDHVVQVVDVIESYRETLSGLADFYLSSVSNRMNEIMKVLTIFAAVFIPLTFIAGIYGMNFEYMPELKWKYSYFIVLGVFGVVAVGLLLFFKRKRWV